MNEIKTLMDFEIGKVYYVNFIEKQVWPMGKEYLFLILSIFSPGLGYGKSSITVESTIDYRDDRLVATVASDNGYEVTKFVVRPHEGYRYSAIEISIDELPLYLYLKFKRYVFEDLLKKDPAVVVKESYNFCLTGMRSTDD